jgi:hypothetical protein
MNGRTVRLEADKGCTVESQGVAKVLVLEVAAVVDVVECRGVTGSGRRTEGVDSECRCLAGPRRGCSFRVEGTCVVGCRRWGRRGVARDEGCVCWGGLRGCKSISFEESVRDSERGERRRCCASSWAGDRGRWRALLLSTGGSKGG